MPGTMEGLGIPLYGAYATEDNSGNTILTVNTNGSHDFTFADLAADNCIDLVVTNSTAVSSGYVQGFHINLTSTATMTGGQINGLAIDFTLGGTPGVECSAIYIYYAASSPTVTALQGAGVTINMEDMGAAPTHYTGMKIYRNVTNQGSTVDSFFYLYDSGTGVSRSVIAHQGNNQPEYFLRTLSAAPSSGMIQTIIITQSEDSTKALRISDNSTIYFIPLHAATS